MIERILIGQKLNQLNLQNVKGNRKCNKKYE